MSFTKMLLHRWIIKESKECKFVNEKQGSHNICASKNFFKSYLDRYLLVILPPFSRDVFYILFSGKLKEFLLILRLTDCQFSMYSHLNECKITWKIWIFTDIEMSTLGSLKLYRFEWNLLNFYNETSILYL